MTNTSAPQDPVLYCNNAKSVILIDLVGSLSVALQGSQCARGSSVVACSDPPIQTPFPSTEPKTSKKQAAVRSSQDQSANSDSFPVTFLENALSEIRADRAQRKAAWHLPRKAWPPRARAAVDEPLRAHVRPASFDGHLDIVALSDELHVAQNSAQLQGRLVINRCNRAVKLRFQDPELQYFIPPGACFWLGEISRLTALPFSLEILQRYPVASTTSAAGPGEFDVIVLDPPWPNRSARRSQAYQTSKTPSDCLDDLIEVAERHLGPEGLVCCWITNKQSVRQAAIDFFKALGLQFMEEWAWLKVTAHGDTVTPLGSQWRKPYEVLLVGRSNSDTSSNAISLEAVQTTVTKRVVASVPDAHSRKPNLRVLLHTFYNQDIDQCRVLELFARNLTSGWCAWGNECLKFNEIRALSFDD